MAPSTYLSHLHQLPSKVHIPPINQTLQFTYPPPVHILKKNPLDVPRLLRKTNDGGSIYSNKVSLGDNTHKTSTILNDNVACNNQTCFQRLWYPCMNSWKSSWHEIFQGCVCPPCKLHVYYCKKHDNSFTKYNNIIQNNVVTRTQFPSSRQTNDINYNNTCSLSFSNADPGQPEDKFFHNERGPSTSLIPPPTTHDRNEKLADLEIKVPNISFRRKSITDDIFFSDEETPFSETPEKIASISQHLPFFQEEIGPDGIYKKENIKPTMEKLVSQIDPDTENDNDELIKFTAMLAGKDNTANALIFLDSGSQENIISPSILQTLNKNDYVEVDSVILKSADGSNLATRKRIRFLPHAGIKLGKDINPIPFTASVLNQNSQHYDILLAVNTIRNMGPVNVIISNSNTILKFYGLYNSKGEQTPTIVTCHHPASTPARMINSVTIEPLQEQEVRILSFKPEVFLPLHSTELPLIGVQKNFFTDDNGKCLKFTGTSTVKLINNTNNPITLIKGQSVAVALSQKKTFITSKEQSVCPNEKCECQDQEKIKENKKNIEKIMCELKILKQKEVIDDCVKILERKFSTLSTIPEIAETNKTILGKKYELPSNKTDNEKHILRETTPLEKLEKEKKLLKYFNGEDEPCSDIIVMSAWKRKCVTEEQKSLIEQLKRCSKKKFECENNLAENKCAHFNKNINQNSKQVNSVSKTYEKINSFDFMETESSFNSSVVPPMDEDIFNNLEAINNEIYQEISKTKTIQITDEELTAFKNLSVDTLRKYVHTNEIKEFLRFFWQTFTTEKNITSLPQMPEGWLTDNKTFPATDTILAATYSLVKKGEHYHQDPFIRINFRIIYFRYRNTIAKFSWNLGTFSKKVFIHKRSLKKGTHSNKQIRPYRLSQNERKQMKNYVKKLERLKLLKHVAKGQNSEIINLFLVKKHQQNEGIPTNYNHQLTDKGLIEMDKLEKERINKIAKVKNINIINVNESEIDEGFESDLEQDEDYDDQESENEIFLSNPTVKNFENWKWKQLERKVLSINKPKLKENSTRIEEHLNPRKTEKGSLAFIRTVLDSMQLMKKTKLEKKHYKHREVRSMLRDMLTTACQISKENQLKLFNGSKLGQWHKERIIGFQVFLENCKEFWTKNKTSALEWPLHLSEDKYFDTLTKLTPYFLSATIGKTIMIFVKEYGTIKKVIRKDMEEFGLGEYVDKNESSIPVIQMIYKGENIWQATTGDIKLFNQFQENLYRNNYFKLNEDNINEVVSTFENLDDGFFEEPSETQGFHTEPYFNASNYNLPTIDDNEKTTVLSKEEQMNKLYEQKLEDENNRFKNLRLVSNFIEYNSKTEPHQTVLPSSEQIRSILGSGGPNASFSSLDANQYYFQLYSEDSYCDSILFAIEHNLYRPQNYVPQGDSGAPSAASFCSQYFIKGLEEKAAVMIDDLAIVDKNAKNQLDSLEKLFKNVIEFSEKAKTCRFHPGKITVFDTCINFAGAFIQGDKIYTETHKASEFLKARPITNADLSSLLSYCSYFRSHISCLSDKIYVLQEQVSKHSKHTKILWTDPLTSEYNNLVKIMDNLPPLYLLPENDNSKLHIYADASKYSIGSVVCMEKKIGEELYHAPIQFMSRMLQGSEKNYSVASGEMLSVTDTIQKYNYLFRGKQFVVHTDSSYVYNNIRKLQRGEPIPDGSLRRLATLLEGYHFSCSYIRTDKTPADHLSRYPLLKHKTELMNLPLLDKETGCIKIKTEEIESQMLTVQQINKKRSTSKSVNVIQQQPTLAEEQHTFNFEEKTTEKTIPFQKKSKLVEKLLQIWQFSTPFNLNIVRMNFLSPTQEKAQKLTESVIQDHLILKYEKDHKEVNMKPTIPSIKDLENTLKTILDSPELLAKNSEMINSKINSLENAGFVWNILLKCVLEVWFLEFDDLVADNQSKLVNAVLTRGTPSTQDSVFEARDLANLQRLDKKIEQIIKQIENKPDNPAFRKLKQNPKKLIHGTTFTLVNRILLAATTTKSKQNAKDLKIVLPEELQLVVTWKRHNTGHLAEANTLLSLKEKYFWNKTTSNFTMFSTAQRVCRSCLVCQFFTRRSKYPNPKLGLLHLSTTTKCGEGVIADIWESGNNSGKKTHLAIAVCARCRYTQARALKTVNSTTISKFLLSCVQTQIPKFFLTDNASYFISKETRELFEGLNDGLFRTKHQDGMNTIEATETKNEHPENIVEILLQKEQADISNIIEIIPINMDGACLYRACITANNTEIGGELLTTQSKELREKSMEVAKTLIAIPDILNQFTSLPTNVNEKATLIDNINTELALFQHDPKKWTTVNREIKFLEDILITFVSAYLQQIIFVIKPDSSITKIDGFQSVLNFIPEKDPIFLFLKNDHFETIKMKPGYTNFKNIIQDRLNGQNSFLTPQEVKDLVSQMITTKTNDRYDHRASDVEKIKHKTSSAIYPQGHSMIERCIGSTAAVLTRLFEKFPQNWENYLERTILILNSKIHKSIGISPMAMHFRRLQSEITPDIIDIVQSATEENLPPAMSQMKNELRLLQEIFAEKQLAKYFLQIDKQWKKNNPSLQTDHNYRIGQNCLMKKLLPCRQKLRPSVSLYGPATILELVGTRALKIQFWSSGFIVNRHYSHLQPFMEPLEQFSQFPSIQRRIEEQRKEFYNSPTQNISKLFKNPIEETDNPDIAMSASGQIFWIGPLDEGDKIDKLYDFDEEESIFLKDLESNGISPDLTPSMRARKIWEEDTHGSQENTSDIKIVLPNNNKETITEDDAAKKKKKTASPTTSRNVGFDNSVTEAPIIGDSFGVSQRVPINDATGS